MILAAGLSPAWQQILQFDAFRPGEVNRANAAHWCGSGKVLNVGLALHHLGGPSCTLAPLGGMPRAAIEQEMAQIGLPLLVIPTAAPTRVCTTILDSATGHTSELVENARPLTAAEYHAFEQAYAQAALRSQMVVLTGSVPAGTPGTFFRDLLAVTACPAVLDLRGELLLAALEFRPLVVKPNREELAATLGLDLSSDEMLHQGMQRINQLGAQWVVVSQGKSAVWISHQSGVFRIDPPAVAEAINPIACGDCLAAGIAWAINAGHPPLDAVRFGVAAAVENLRDLLPARLDPLRVAAQAARIAPAVRINLS